MTSRVIIMREATIRIVKMLAEKEVKVTQRGAKTYVEYNHVGRPVRVNIPYMPDDASDELLDAIQGFMDHEVAHILFTDFRALAEAKRKGVARLHNIIEDSFIERRMAEHFAGSGLNLRNVGGFFLKTYTDVELVKSPENAEGLLFVPAVRAWAGQSIFIDYMADKWHMLEKVTAALGDAVNEVKDCKTSMDCLALSIKFRDLLEAAKPKRPKPEPKPEPEPEDDKVEPDDAEPMPGSSDDAEPDEPGEMPEFDFDGSKPEERDHDEAESDPAPSEEGEPTPSEEGSGEDSFDAGGEEPAPSDEGDEDIKVTGEGEGDAEGDDKKSGIDADPGVTEVDHKAEVDKGEDDDEEEGKEGEDEDEGPSLLDELDKKMGDKEYDDAIADALTEMSVEGAKESDYLIYTTELDVIEPMEVWGRHGDAYLKSMTDTVDHMVGPLQKDLERAIAARSAATWSAGHRSGRLHPSALARLTTFNDDRVFRRKHVNESKDVAVSLLVDCSGSMHGSKIRTAAFAAYGLSAVLDRMMIANEVLGFTTQENLPAEMSAEEHRLGVRYARRQNIYIPILKSFSERMNSESKKRFASLPNVSWLCENVDGESVQIAASRLAQRREKRKILIVLSDGQPACPGDFKQLVAHLKKSVKDVERSGIDVIGIGIESDAPRHFYSKHVVLRDVSDLPTTVIGELKKFLMK